MCVEYREPAGGGVLGSRSALEFVSTGRGAENSHETSVRSGRTALAACLRGLGQLPKSRVHGLGGGESLRDVGVEGNDNDIRALCVLSRVLAPDRTREVVLGEEVVVFVRLLREVHLGRLRGKEWLVVLVG